MWDYTYDDSHVSVVSIVSEDARVRDSVKRLIESAGLQADSFPTLQALLGAEQPRFRSCLVFHLRNDALNDPAQQARLRAACAECPCIVMTEPDDVRTAVRASKAGVRDVVQTTCRDKELLERILDALEAHEPT